MGSVAAARTMPATDEVVRGRISAMAARPRLSPAQLLGVGFAGLIAAGTVLLSLPVSWGEPGPISLLDAFFTATSAVCVTGLIVVDTPRAFSAFGLGVVLVLIQAGGLGYMVVSTVLSVALGKRLSLQERLTLQEALNLQSREHLLRFTWTVVRLTLAFEAAGALLLSARWWNEMGPARAIAHGVFHAVSAFNNAGFALFSDSLVRYRGDLVVNIVITTLVLCGGLGFLVLSEVGRWRPRSARTTGRGALDRTTPPAPLSVHARLVLAVSATLLVVGTVTVFALERGNPATLGALDPGDAWLAAYFQSVVSRTAGFNTIDVGAAREATLFVLVALMFIGASPGSTGGGVKTTTFAITVAALWATVRGREDTMVFRRRLAPALVARAFFISLIAFLAVNVTATALLVTEARPFLPTLFETTSAFGTVGLSTGLAGAPVSLSGGLSAAGKLLIAGMMFVGRIGPLTLAVALARSGAQVRMRHPEGKVLIG
jgi:trk system potassium uptake protein